MSKVKPEVVLNKELIRKISAVTDYHIYEVEDVMQGFSKVVGALLQEGKEVRLENLFSVLPKVIPPRDFIHPSTGAVGKSKGSVGLSVKPSDNLKGRMVDLLTKQQ